MTSRTIALAAIFAANQGGMLAAYAYATRSLALAFAYLVVTTSCGVASTITAVGLLGLDYDHAKIAGVVTGVVCFYAGLAVATHKPVLAFALVVTHQAASVAFGYALKRLS